MKLFGGSFMRHFKVASFFFGLLALTAACNQATGKLSQADEQKFAAEGIVKRADDLDFRFTHDV